MQISVAVRTPTGWAQQQIKYIQELSERHTKRLAEETETIIKSFIEASIKDKKNSSGTLINCFYAKPLPDGSGWGIGEIDELNNKCVYWYVQEVGSNCNMHILPKGFWDNGQWVESEDGYFSSVKKPILAKNYIANTLAQIPPLIDRALREK